jgi:UDP-2,3-diacylglucosamine hydrolase
VKVFFLSDLHLENGDSPAAERFRRFLGSEPSRGDMVLLGGDIFDLLVGDKAVFRGRFRAVLDALVHASSRGVQIHYLEGNHDFHFRSLFRGQTNILVRTEDFSITLPGHRLWIAHGDLIDRDDRGYLLLRAATKNAPFRAFVRAMPGSVVDWIGSHSSGASRKYTAGRVENEGTERLRRIYLEFAKAKVREGFDHVLVGHSHLRDHVPIEDGASRGEYLNLGFNAERLLYAVLEPGVERFVIREVV